MKSLAKKESNTIQAVPMKEKDRIYYPSITFSSKVMPDVKDMRMGDTIEIKCKCKVKGLHKGYSDDKEINCEMDMVACEIIDGADDFKEAKRLKLDRKDFDEYKSKKEKANA